MTTQPLIGVICDASFSALAGRIKTSGYRIARVSPGMLVPGSLPPVDAWVVDCNDTDLIADALTWIETPVMALSNRPEPTDRIAYKAWGERIVRALDKWTANARHCDKQKMPQSSATAWADVQGVWVLVGSLGAERAVAEFLGALPWIPPVAMVYAQHWEGSQTPLVEQFSAANKRLKCSMALGRNWLNPGHMLVTPNDCRIQFAGQGEVFSMPETWGPRAATPHIDKLVLDLMGLRSGVSGMIVFSGGSSDGLQAARALNAMGTRIWCQTPRTAVRPGLPMAVQKLKLASNHGTPAELAADFADLYAVGQPRPMLRQVSGLMH